jgi:uncharacterized protein with PIN domain
VDVVLLMVEVHPDLRFLLPARRREPAVAASPSSTDTVGHVVESLGIPLTEVGSLLLDGVAVPSAARARAGTLRVSPVQRPVNSMPHRCLADVHLGSLARKLRLLGIDTAYVPGADDDELVAHAIAQERVLLTQDRQLLCRRALPHGALVRGTGAAEQLDDVLDRFAPELNPWTRCAACNGLLAPTRRESVVDRLPAGTRRTYEEFVACRGCGHVYWHGAHSRRLEALVARAVQVVGRRTGGVAHT